MKMMERIKQIWTQLEASSSTVAGLFKLRFSDASKCDVFLGVKLPETHRLLILKVPFNIGQEFNFKYEFRGLKFEKIYDPDDSKFLLLNLVLVEKQFKDVFDTLVADILIGLLNESDVRIILKNYSNRLIKWQSLFEKYNEGGLTPEEQRGLFGELFFMREFFNSKGNTTYIVNSWVGPENAVIDFQSNNWGVEVKTTSGNNHQKVNISNERQLDTKNYEHLFLYHISLDQRQNSGESLNDIVLSLKDLLSKDELVLNKFIHKLFEAGYFDVHIPLYKECGYSIRQNTFYKVENDFPRIEEKDVQNGLGDIRYSIILSYCNNFIVNYEFVFNLLNVE